MLVRGCGDAGMQSWVFGAFVAVALAAMTSQRISQTPAAPAEVQRPFFPLAPHTTGHFHALTPPYLHNRLKDALPTSPTCL